MESVEAVEKILNYSFTNKNLLKEAISNGSIESTPKFQRLEFLGDSVLEVAITNHIHLTAPNIRTRELRKLRHANVRNEKFARAAVRNNLYQYMIRDTHDLQQTKQVKVFSEAVREENGPVLDHGLVKAPKVLADLVESIAGAVYIDVNFDLQRFWEIFRGLLEPIYTMDDLLAANKALRQMSESMHIERIVDEDNLDVETEDKKEISSTESFQLQTGSSSLPTASEMAQEEEMVIDEDSPHVESEDAKGKSCEIFSARKLQIETGSSSLSPNALTYEMTTKQMVVDEDSLEAGPEAKTKLFIICNKNKWPNPIFSVEEIKGPEKKQKYVCSVKIEIPSVQGTFHMKGDVKLRKKDAEYSAAYHMIRALNSSLMSLVISNLKMQKSLDEEKRKQNSLDEKKNLHSKKRKRKSLVENMNLQMLDKLEEKKNLQMQEILDEKNLQTQEISDEKKNMQTQESSEENKNLEKQEGLDKKKNLQMRESSDEKILNSVEAETDSVEAVEKILNYSFTNKTLLKDAITQHSSSYDRIKFVGEAALPHAITNHIYLANPTLQPTELTLLRAAIRTTQKYAFVAAKLGLHQFFIRNVKDQEKIKWFTELVSKEDNPDPHGVFVKPPHVLRVLLEILAGAVYIDVNYDIKRLWQIFKPLFEPICTLDDLRRQPQPVVTLFRWADKYDKRIEIRYSECSDGKRTVAQVFLDDELLACGEPRESWDSTKLTAVKKAIPKLLAKGFTVEMVMDEDSRHVEIEDAKEKLIEICNKRKLPNPIYSVEEKGEGVGYVCSATIETPTEEGTLCILGDRKSRRKIAENSSATHMIRALTFSLKDDM